jgi:anti-sigma factor RsiW
MSCDNIAQIHAFHDGALPENQRAAVEAHLAVCAECRELLEDLQRLSTMFATVPFAEMSPRATSKMYGSYWAARQKQDRGVRLLAEWLTAAAAVVMLVAQLQINQKNVQRPEVAETPWVDTIAFIPPAEARDNPNSQLMQVAQFMATELDAERQ